MFRCCLVACLLLLCLGLFSANAAACDPRVAVLGNGFGFSSFHGSAVLVDDGFGPRIVSLDRGFGRSRVLSRGFGRSAVLLDRGFGSRAVLLDRGFGSRAVFVDRGFRGRSVLGGRSFRSGGLVGAAADALFGPPVIIVH